MDTKLIILPSCGKVYSIEGVEEKSRVEIREPLGKDEMLLTNTSLLGSGDVFIRLIQNLLVDKKWKNVDFLSADSEAILFAIRYLMYGNYKNKVVCPECKTEQEYEFQLNELRITTLDVDPVEPGKNLFLFVASDGTNIQFSLPTDNFEKELSIFISKNKGKSGINFLFERHIRLVKSINNMSEPDKIRNYIENGMKVSTFKEFRDYVKSITPGVIKTYETRCNNCAASFNVDMTMGADFFWVI